MRVIPGWQSVLHRLPLCTATWLSRDASGGGGALLGDVVKRQLSPVGSVGPPAPRGRIPRGTNGSVRRSLCVAIFLGPGWIRARHTECKEQGNGEPLAEEESVHEHVVERRKRSRRARATHRFGRGKQTTGCAYETNRPILDRRLAGCAQAAASPIKHGFGGRPAGGALSHGSAGPTINIAFAARNDTSEGASSRGTITAAGFCLARNSFGGARSTTTCTRLSGRSWIAQERKVLLSPNCRRLAETRKWRE